MTYYAIGFRRKRQNTVLDIYYPTIKTNKKDLDQLSTVLSININRKTNSFYELNESDYQKCRDSIFYELPPEKTKNDTGYQQVDIILIVIQSLDQNIENTEEAYFRLQLLSQRLVKPNEQNLNGIFTELQTIAWSNVGPILPNDLPEMQSKAIMNQKPMMITHVDKFPYMVNYHIPSAIRIADASRVRLGAYLGAGTTIMPAGFVNFNAGTLGNAMIEGRISAGVVVGEDSDVGGGASIMGTLSGGNEHVISIGKKCLLGANAGTGISLGDGCTIAAGVYVYAGKKVRLLDENNNAIDINGNTVSNGQNIVKARDLSGSHYRLFIEDSQTGELICKPNSKVIQLNEALHINE